MNRNNLLIKNSLYIYIRMVVYIVTGLITSRIVLSNLGVNDFGVYNIVGSVVTTLGFLHTSLTGATNRFLSASLVNNSIINRKITFATALSIHIVLALFVGILLETVGLSFLINNVSIPNDRFEESLIVFHISSLSSVLILMYIPFEAAIISNERMGLLAKLSIFEAFLKLALSFTIGLVLIDNLIYYSIYLLAITLIIRVISILYCVKYFEECKFIFKYNRSLGKEIFSFFSLDLYGNVSVMLKNSGLSVLQNNFFGVIINASENISQQVNSSLTILSNGFFSAVKPQIFKSYAENDMNRFYQLINISVKYSCYLVSLIGFPIFFGVDYILHLWLANVPQYADGLIKICVIEAIVNSFNMPIIASIHATGKIKKISFISGSLFLCVLPISYLILLYFGNPYSSGMVTIIILFVVMLTNCKILNSLLPSFPILEYVKIVIINIVVLLILFSFFWFVSSFISVDSIFKLLAWFVFSSMTTIITVYFFVCHSVEKNMLKKHIYNFLNEKFK